MNLSGNQGIVPSSNTPWVFSVFQLILAFFIVLENGIVLIAMIKYLHRLTPACLLIINLTVADIVMGLVLPVQVASRLSVSFAENDSVCSARISTMVLASFSSLFAVLLTAVDRYLGVCRCISYYKTVTIKRTTGAIVCMWIYAVVVAFYPFRFYNQDIQTTPDCVMKQHVSHVYVGFMPFQYFSILIIMCYIYCHICRTALNRRRTISVDQGFVLSSRVLRLERELRAARLMALILIVFVFCWTPFAVTQIYDITESEVNPTVVKFTDTSAFLGILNSVVNPFIYPLQNRDFKKAFTQVFLCRTKLC